jgi:hypothetical protein
MQQAIEIILLSLSGHNQRSETSVAQPAGETGFAPNKTSLHPAL